MLLKGEGEAEEQRLLAEYWQANYHLLETGMNISYQRVADNIGAEKAETIFKEVLSQRSDQGTN